MNLKQGLKSTREHFAEITCPVFWMFSLSDDVPILFSPTIYFSFLRLSV